jgi:hypothetical protein
MEEEGVETLLARASLHGEAPTTGESPGEAAGSGEERPEGAPTAVALRLAPWEEAGRGSVTAVPCFLVPPEHVKIVLRELRRAGWKTDPHVVILDRAQIKTCLRALQVTEGAAQLIETGTPAPALVAELLESVPTLPPSASPFSALPCTLP